MNQTPTYHIDVTPEEDALFRDTQPTKSKKQQTKFTKMFVAVFGVHALIVFGIVITAQTTDALEIKKEIRIDEPQQLLGSPDPDELIPKNVNPAAKSPINAAPNQSKPTNEHQTKHSVQHARTYTVKPGDTITSISKKFKLSSQRLIEINQIKNPNKIAVGQQLRFFSN